MKLSNFRIFHLCALFMLMVVLLSPVAGACHGDDHCAALQEVPLPDPAQPDSPCCPDTGHHAPTHDNCSACPCHAQILPSEARLSITCLESTIAVSEQPHFLPDVYLSLFDPPDVAA